MQILPALASLLAAAALLGPAVLRRAYRAHRVPERRTPRDLGLPYRTVSISTAKGKRLFGWLVLATSSGRSEPDSTRSPPATPYATCAVRSSWSMARPTTAWRPQMHDASHALTIGKLTRQVDLSVETLRWRVRSPAGAGPTREVTRETDFGSPFR